MKIDLHTHTRYSKDSASKPEKVVKTAKLRGLDGVAITDHNSIKAWKEAKEASRKHKFPVVLGEEVKVSVAGHKKGEILGLFLTEQIKSRHPMEAIDEIKSQGGIAIVAHPFDKSRGFLELSELPQRLIVLGGGYIGCELACMAAMLGVEVVVVELLEDILVQLDEDVRREVKRSMTGALGIRIVTGHALEGIKAGKDGVSGSADGEQLAADLLLAAVGRRPVTDGLGIEAAGVTPNEKGYIDVDEVNRTRVAGIYAVGDVNGGPQLAHAATAQGIAAADNACGGSRRGNEGTVPAVIFTQPEVALAGLTENRAAEQGVAVKVGKFTYAALGRALAAGEPAGFAKWIVDAETDQLLGAAVVGARATDLISEAAVAIRNELTAVELGNTIHAHPTFGEIWMEAAHAVHGRAIHAAPRRRARG